MTTPRKHLDEQDAVRDRRIANLHDQQVAMAKAINKLQSDVAILRKRIPEDDIVIPVPAPAPPPVVVPEPQPVPAPGEGFIARQPRADAVKASEGDDLGSKLNEAQQKRTDLLLRAGDRFTGSLGKLWRSGTMIGSYGEGPRPVIESKDDILFVEKGSNVNNAQIVGLEFRSLRRDPRNGKFSRMTWANSAIIWHGSGEDILVEDCVVEFFAYGMVFDSTDRDTGKFIDGLTLNRNIIRYCWNTGHGNRAGVITGWVKGLVVEENVFDHNGHLPTAWGVSGATPDDQSHALYLAPLPEESGPRTGFEATVRGNIFARSGSHGIKGGPGGVLEDNLFVGNAIAGYMSRSDSEILGNVVLDATDISDDNPRGWGLEAFGMGLATFTGNVYANPAVTSDDKRRDFHSSAGRTVASGNHVYADTAGSVEMEGTEYHRRRLDHGVDLDRLINDESSRGHGQWTGDIAQAIQQVQEAAR